MAPHSTTFILPTFDVTILITTLCVLFYFISPFLLLKSSLRSHYHTHHCCMGTTAMVYARGMTIQPHPQVHKPPCCHCILPLAPTPTATIALFVGTQVMFFSFLFFCPFSNQSYKDSLYLTHQVLKPPPLHHVSHVTPQALQVPLLPLPHSWAHK